jgi:hypothetical protein
MEKTGSMGIGMREIRPRLKSKMFRRKEAFLIEKPSVLGPIFRGRNIFLKKGLLNETE